MNSNLIIDFYILEEKNKQKSQQFVCHLVEKSYLNQQSVYIHVSSQKEAENMDALLWTFRDISFLPHQIYNPITEDAISIQIGFGEAPAVSLDILINLSTEIPNFYSNFKQVIEIVFSEATMQQLARKRYRQYRDQGHEVVTHNIKMSH